MSDEREIINGLDPVHKAMFATFSVAIAALASATPDGNRKVVKFLQAYDDSLSDKEENEVHKHFLKVLTVMLDTQAQL